MRSISKTSILTMVVLILLLSVSAQAAYTNVNLPTLNTDLTTWSDGSAYNNLFPSSQTFAGVPFQLQLNSSGYNAYEAFGNNTLDISTSIYGATNVYTLINTAYGSSGSTVGSITFIGNGGADYTVNLIEGYNVRDHYFNPNPFVNTTTAPYVTQAVFGLNQSGYAHLDMQDFALPSAFQTQTLTDIQFAGINAGYPQGEPFIAGLTVAGGSAPVPEPSTFLLLGASLAGLAGLRLRRRNR